VVSSAHLLRQRLKVNSNRKTRAVLILLLLANMLMALLPIKPLAKAKEKGRGPPPSSAQLFISASTRVGPVLAPEPISVICAERRARMLGGNKRSSQRVPEPRAVTTPVRAPATLLRVMR